MLSRRSFGTTAVSAGVGLIAEGADARTQPATTPAIAASRLIALDARPEPVRIETGRCAVLVVDQQNDFGAPGGMLGRKAHPNGNVR